MPSAGTANVCDGWSGRMTLERLAVDELAARRALRPAEERVAQAARAVEVVDRHVHGRVRGQRPDRRALPLPGVVADEVRDPVGVSGLSFGPTAATVWIVRLTTACAPAPARHGVDGEPCSPSR